MCSHNYEEQAIFATRGELIEECSKCGKERRRNLEETDLAVEQ